jgi:hypothetical protein
MPQAHVNFVAVVVVALINMVIGAIYYSPAVAGRRWMALVGKRPEDMRREGAQRGYIGSFIGALILAYVLARVLGLVGAGTVGSGLEMGFWIWLGFVATTSSGDYLFAGRPTQLYIINNIYHLITLLINGALLAVWH